MALTKAPLFSLDASGTVGSSVVFSKWKGRNYVRRHAVPHNPQADMQVAVRACFQFITQAWAALTSGNKATWDTLAAASNISPFNAYVSNNQFRFRNGLGLTHVYPYAGGSSTPTAPTTTPSGGVRQVTLSIADGATPPDWGWMIHGHQSTGFTPSWANVIKIAPRSGTPTVWVDAPLDAATYYYRVRGISKDAALGALEVERNGTAT